MLRFIFLYVRVFVFGLLVSFGSFVLYLCLFFVHNLTIRWMHIGFRSRGGFGNRCLLLLFLFVFFLMFAGLLSRLLRSNRLRLLGFLRLLLGLFGLGGFGAGLTRSLALLADDLVLFFFFVLGRFGLGLLLLEHPHLTIVLLLFPGGLLVVRGLLGLRQHLPLLAHSLNYIFMAQLWSLLLEGTSPRILVAEKGALGPLGCSLWLLCPLALFLLLGGYLGLGYLSFQLCDFRCFFLFLLLGLGFSLNLFGCCGLLGRHY